LSSPWEGIDKLAYAGVQTVASPNVQLTQSLFELFAAGDSDGDRRLLAPDIE
jgi:hypothetical protein